MFWGIRWFDSYYIIKIFCYVYIRRIIYPLEIVFAEGNVAAFNEKVNEMQQQFVAHTAGSLIQWNKSLPAVPKPPMKKRSAQCLAVMDDGRRVYKFSKRDLSIRGKIVTLFSLYTSVESFKKFLSKFLFQSW